MSFVMIFFYYYFYLFFQWSYGYIILKNKFKHAVSEEEYEILINSRKGEFNAPVKECTRLQKKKATIKFWIKKIEIYSGQFYADHIIL